MHTVATMIIISLPIEDASVIKCAVTLHRGELVQLTVINKQMLRLLMESQC